MSYPTGSAPGPAREARSARRARAAARADHERAQRSDADMTRIAPAPRPEMTDEGRWLVAVCRRELECEPDRARAARLYFEIARALADPRESLDAYCHALELNPDHLPSIRAARRLHLERRDIKAAIELFDGEIRLVDDLRAKARLWFARGRALEDCAGNVEGARECYRRAVQLDPTCPTYLVAAAQTDHGSEDWVNLSRTREGLANAIRHDNRHRAALLVERARLLETRLSDIESATELYEQATALEVTTSSTSEALKRLLYVQSRWRDLCRVLEREAATTTDPAVKTHALFAISRLHSERLGDRAEAVRALTRAMQVAPSDRLVLESMARLYEEAGEQLSLSHALAHAVEATRDDAERLALMHRIGHIYERRLGDDENARRWYEAALRLAPDHPPVLRALDNLYERSRAWEALIVMHLAAAEATASSVRRAQAHARIAGIFEDHVHRDEEAIRHHALALSLDGKLEGSFKSLARLYAKHRRHRELIELYERGVESAPEEDLRTAYLMKIGLTYEESLDDPTQAMHAYERILARRPHDLAALHALQRAADRAHRHPELALALEREAGLTSDVPRQTALLHRAAEVLAERLRDLDAATAMLKRVLALEPRYAPGLASLGRIYQERGRHEALRDIYERELEITPKGPKEVALLFKLGELCERELADNERAIGFYRRAIAVDPSHEPSLRALSLQLRRRGDFKGLVGVLQSELIAEQPSALRATRAYRLGEVYETHLADYERATAAYTQALEAVPSYRPAIAGLHRVRTQLADWRAQANELQAEAVRVEDPSLAIDALLRAGALHAELLGAPEQAIAVYEAVRRIQNDNLPALQALEPLYRNAGAHQKLAELYATLATVLTDPGARISALEELARLHETHDLGDAADVHGALSAIVALNPTHMGALEGLERLALGTGDAALLADVDARFSRTLTDPALVAAHQTRLGVALIGQNPAAAVTAFRHALEHEPGSITAMRGLRRAARACGDAHAMVEALSREAAWTQLGDLAADALVESAQLRLEHLGDVRGAIADAERALERWPDHEQAARTLGDLLREAREIERLITLLSRAAGSATDTGRVASLWRVVSRLYADEKGDLGAALASLDRVPEEHARHHLTLKLRGDLYVRNQQWKDAVETYEQALGAEPTRETRFAIHMELGRIHLNRTKDHKLATVHFRAAVKLDSTHREAVMSLFDLYKQVEDWDSARLAGQNVLKVVHGPTEQAWAWRQLGHVELKAGRRRQGADALRAAVAIEGPFGDAAKEYKKLLGDDEPWDRYVAALLEHIQRVQRGELESQNLRDIFAAVARIQYEVLLKAEDAVTTLRAGLAATGGDRELHLELADRLAQVGRRDDAIVEYRRVLMEAPATIGAWRGLARAFHEAGHKLESGVLLAPLVVLGAASDIEGGMARQRRVHPGEAQPDSFNRDALLKISAGEAAAEPRISALFASVLEALAKLYPTDFERYGVSARDRLKTDHPLFALTTRVARPFGIPELDVYLHRTPVSDVVVELTQPPSIMIPELVTKLPEAQQVFLIARALVSLARDMHPAITLGRREVTRVVVASLRTVAPTYGSGRFSDDDINQLQKRIYKALSRRNKKALETAAALYLAEPTIELDRWGQTLELTTARAAALLTNDLPAVLSVLRQTGATPARAEGAAIVTGSPTVTDLFRFWPTPEAFDLRRQAGIL